MELFARWDSRTQRWIFYICNAEKPTVSETCRYCIKRYKGGTVISSNMFFKDSGRYVIGSIAEYKEKFRRISFPVCVKEKAIIIDSKHEPLTEIPRSAIYRSLVSVFREVNKMLVREKYDRIIVTSQSGIVNEGTLSHPHFRLFALNLGPINLSSEKIFTISNDDIVYENTHFRLINPFVRDFVFDLRIIGKHSRINAHEPKRFMDSFLDVFLKGIEILEDIPFQAVLDFKNDNVFYVRFASDNKLYPWPLSAFQIANFPILLGDLDDVDSRIKYYLTRREKVGEIIE